jgi:hypothetical protein
VLMCVRVKFEFFFSPVKKSVIFLSVRTEEEEEKISNTPFI